MAVQWDSEKNKLGGLIPDLLTLREAKKNAPTIDDEVLSFLESVNGNKKFDPSKLNDDGFEEYGIKSEEARQQLADFFETAESGSDYVEGFKEMLGISGEEAGKFASSINKAKDVLKGFGAALGSMAINWAIGEVIGLIVTQIDNYVNRIEIAIEKAEEAQGKIDKINSEFEGKKKVIEEYTESYAKLAEGVNLKNNENLDLPEEEYQQFLDITNELADTFPQLQQGFDDNGNAILNFGEDASNVTQKLEELLETEKKFADIEISKNFSDLFDGFAAQVEIANNAKVNTDDIQAVEDSLGNLKDIANNGIKLTKDVQQIIFDGNNTASVQTLNTYQQAMADLYKEYKGEKLEYVAGVTPGENIIVDGVEKEVYDVYFEGLNKEQKEYLESRIQYWASEFVADAADDADLITQEFEAAEQDAKKAWEDLLPSLTSTLESKGSFGLLGEYEDYGDELQQFVSNFTSKLDYSIGKKLAETKKNPYDYIKESIIQPLLSARPEDRKEIVDAYSNLLTLNPNDLTQANQDAIEESLTAIRKHLKITNLTDKDGKEIDILKATFGLNYEEELGDSYNAFKEEISKYFDSSKAAVKKEMEFFNREDTIDFTVRPLTPTTQLEKMGYDHQDPGIATVYSSTYTNETGDKAVVVTPILPNGRILTPEELDGYASDLLDGKEIDVDIKMGMFSGKDAQEQADRFAEQMHSLQEEYFFGDEISQAEADSIVKELKLYSQQELDDFTELLKLYENVTLAKKVYNRTHVETVSLEDATSDATKLKEELTALQEVLADTDNIQVETYEKLIGFSKDYASAIKTENGRISVNTARLKQVAKARQLDTKESLRQTIAHKKQEWVQWKNNIQMYNGVLLDSITSNYENIDALEQEITQYELLANSIEVASGAYQKFIDAQSTENHDMYDTAQQAYTVMNDVLNNSDSELFGQYNSDDFKGAMELLLNPEDYEKLLDTDNMEDFIKLAKDAVKSLEPLFNEKNGQSVRNLLLEVQKIINSGDVPYSDEDWADRLGISVDLWDGLKPLANLYGFNGEDIIETESLHILDAYTEKLMNVEEAQRMVNDSVGESANAQARYKRELEEAQQEADEYYKKQISSIQDKYKEYQKTDTSSGSFNDYLKSQFEYNENDIEGISSILVQEAGKCEDVIAELDEKGADYGGKRREIYQEQLDVLTEIMDKLGIIDNKEVSATVKVETAKYNQKVQDYNNLMGRSNDYINTSDKIKSKEQALSATDSVEEAQRLQSEISTLDQELQSTRQSLVDDMEAKLAELDGDISWKEDQIKNLKTEIANSTNPKETEKLNEELKTKQEQQNEYKAERNNLQSQKKQIDAINEENTNLEETKQKVTDILNGITNINNEPVTVQVDTSELDSTITKIDDWINTETKKEIVVSYVPGKSLVDFPTLPTSNNNTGNNKTKDKSKGTPGRANGTFNAFAEGTGADVSIPKDETALVNELGEEGLVRNGKLVPIKGGMQFIKLKRGDIVVNHKQMQDLKEHGYTTGRGKLIGAHAEGTLTNAYNLNQGSEINGEVLTQVMTHNPAINKDINKAADDIKKDIEETKDEAEEAFEDIIDWIERRVKAFQRKVDKWTERAETALTESKITKFFNYVKDGLNNLIKTQSSAYARYMKEANKVGLREDYAKKVRQGVIDIETITDEALADQISKYQEWYDKALDSLDAFEEAVTERFNIPLEKAAQKTELFEEKLELLNAKLENAIGSNSKNNLVDKQTKQEQKILNAANNAEKSSEKNLNKASKQMLKSSILNSDDVSKKEKKQIKNTVKNDSEINLSLFKEGSKAYKAAVKYNEALKANKQATQDAALAQEEYNAWLVESSKTKFDNVAQDYEEQIQLLDNDMTDIDNKIAEIEARGTQMNAAYYRSQKQINNQQLDIYKKEKSALESQIGNIKQGTEEWYEALQQIQDVEDAISGCVQKTSELNTAIRELYLNDLDEAFSDVDKVIAELELGEKFISNEKKTDSETGTYTAAGVAQLGISNAKLSTYLNEQQFIKTILDELERVQASKQLKSETLGLEWDSKQQFEEFYETVESYYSDMTNSVYDSAIEITDSVKEALQAELDMTKDLNDKRKEALNEEKELYDYQRQISEKTQNISSLQKQIAAYTGDTSEEGKANVQRLNASLEDAQQDLQDTEYDKYLSDQEDMLDELYTEYEELITKKMDDFWGLIASGIDDANNNASLIGGYLETMTKQFGYEGDFTKIFGTNIDSINANLNSESYLGKTLAEAILKIGEAETSLGTSINGLNNGEGSLSEKIIEKINSSDAALSGLLIGKENSITSNMSKMVEEILGENGFNVKNGQDKNVTNGANNSSGGTTNTANPTSTPASTEESSGTLVASMDSSRDQKAKNQYEIATKYLDNHVGKTDVSNDVNKQLAKMYGKGQGLGKGELETLEKKLGVIHNNYNKKGNLYKKLKEIGIESFALPGFSKGGIVSVDDIEKQVKANGDSVLVSANKGEGFLTAEQTEDFKTFVGHVKMLDNALGTTLNPVNHPIKYDIPNMGEYFKIDLPDHSKMSSSNQTTTSIGDVYFTFELPNIVDEQSFLNTMQNSQKVQKCLKSMTVDQVAGVSRLAHRTIK